jgi:hypothetical protein
MERVLTSRVVGDPAARSVVLAAVTATHDGAARPRDTGAPT